MAVDASENASLKKQLAALQEKYDQTSQALAQYSQQSLAERQIKDEAFYQLWSSQLTENPGNTCINTAISALCTYLEIDMCSFNVSFEELQRFHAVFIYPIPENTQLATTYESFKDFPWTSKRTLQGLTTQFSKPDDLPAEAAIDIASLKKAHCLSTACHPVVENGHTVAFLSITTCSTIKQWSEQDTLLIDKFKHIIYQAYLKTDNNQTLNEYNNQVLREVLKISHTGYFIWEKDQGIIENKNHLMQDMMHSKTHKSFFKNLSAEDRQLVEKNFENCINNDVGYTLDLQCIDSDSNSNWLRTNASPVSHNIQGEVTRIIITYQDITDDIKQQQILALAIEKSEVASKEKSDFLARMSHEIRTPMNAIIGMAYLLEDSHLSKSQKQKLNSISTSANALLRIINDILDFSKIDAMKLVIEKNHFNIDRLIDETSLLFSGESDKKPIEIIYDIDQDVPRDLYADDQRLKQILVNFLSNAVKFTPKGNIILKISKQSDSPEQTILLFSITDAGIGISEKYLENLFNPFSQADGSISRKYGGTGLGLAICQRLITLMGGEIWVESTEGKGTSFSFTLPVNTSPKGHKDRHITQEQIKNIHALVVDDNETALEITAKTIAQIGLSVDTANSGKEAIEKARNKSLTSGTHYDVIFMDYHMPEIDGVAAAKAIKGDCTIKNSPTVIMVSAHDFSLDKDDKDHVIDAYVHKPISQSRIFDTIAEIFGTGEIIDDVSIHSSPDDYQLLNNLRILLVEDNIVNQKVATGILKKQGVQTHIANNGIECLAALNNTARDNYDLILMDMEMPLMDGISATQAIRKLPIWMDIPIIAMTAHALKGDKERFINAGMNSYISKPIHPKTLYDTLLAFAKTLRQ